MVMGGTGVAARSRITSSTMGEGGGEGNNGRCGTGGKGDMGAICGPMGDKMGKEERIFVQKGEARTAKRV